jgi:hypothetical protein
MIQGTRKGSCTSGVEQKTTGNFEAPIWDKESYRQLKRFDRGLGYKHHFAPMKPFADRGLWNIGADR